MSGNAAWGATPGIPQPSLRSWTRLRAWVSRVLAPGLSYCYRCRTSFWGPIKNEHHSTPYGTNGSGWCFPLCETCWSALTPKERMPYYDALVNTWMSQALTTQEAVEYDKKRDLIYHAVMAGG